MLKSILGGNSPVLLQPNQQLPEGFSRQMFDSLYEQPLCALYASQDTEGFTGRCETLPSHCTRNASWCDNGANPDAQAVQQLMALQLTKVGHQLPSNISM